MSRLSSFFSQPPLQAVGKLRVPGMLRKLAFGLVNLLALLMGLLPVTAGYAAGQAGNVDPTFVSGLGANNIVYSVAAQSDGKILIGGDFVTYKDKPSPRLARLNADSSVDTSFNPGGSGASDTIYSVAVQNDGKILIGGNFISYNGTTRSFIARLNSDGSLDTSFNLGTGTSGTVTSILVQNNGKILLGGSFASYNGTGVGRIVRLNSDGSRDTSFNPGSGANSTVFSLAVQNDDKVIIGGQFTGYSGTAICCLVRLNSDGSLDSSFNSGGSGANGNVYSIAVQGNGKILIGGNFSFYNDTIVNRIARLNSDGSLDSSFNGGGLGVNSIVYSIKVQSDAKVLIGGSFTNYAGIAANRIARLNPDSTLDTSFNPGSGANNIVRSVVVQSDGKILIGGNFTNYSDTGANRLARLNTDGSLDSSFTVGAGADSSVFSVAVQPDGKVIIGGFFTSYNGITRNRIARLNSDGSLDASFNPGSGADSSVNSVAIQSDGKILIGGNFTSYNGAGANRIARLNTDGSLDTSFNLGGSGASSIIQSVVIQNDGKILIGGLFGSYNGTARSSIARLNSDGSLDAFFNPGGSGADSIIHGIVAQNDGKILIGGDFTNYKGTAINRIARLNSDGSLDASFNPGSGPNATLRSVAVQSDGRVLIGGSFNNYNGIFRVSIARLNVDGSLDTSFTSGGGGANDTVWGLAVQNDGRVLIGGDFTTYNSITINRIARLNTNGSLDASFVIGTGADGSVRSIVLHNNDAKITIGGIFTTLGGYNRDRVARLEGKTFSSTSLSSNLNPAQLGQSVTFTATTNPITATGTVQLTFGGSITVTSTLTNGVASYVTSTLPVGDTPVTATYNGDDNFLPGNSSVYTQTVTKIPTSLSVTSSPNPSPFGQAANFTATVQPAAATGTVNFTIGASQVSATLSNGVASYVTTTLAGGDYAVSANYGGSPTYSSSVSTGQYTHTVSPPIPGSIHWQSASYQIGEAGGSAVLTATRTGGTDLAISVTVVISDGTATSADYSPPDSFVLSWANGESGAKTFVLPIVNDTTFEGNENLTLELTNPTGGASLGIPVTTSLTIVEDDLPTTSLSLTSSLNPSQFGQNVSFTATVSVVAPGTGTPSGTITFLVDNAPVATVSLGGGQASYMTTTLPIGTHAITATYSGSSQYLPSQAMFTQTVVAACNPQVVTSPGDNGTATTCGTFSHALASTTSGTITFALTTGNTITFTGSLTPTLKPGVVVDGGVNGIVLNGNGVAGDGLRLGGNNTLTNLTIRNFGGRELIATLSSAANNLFKIKVQT